MDAGREDKRRLSPTGKNLGNFADTFNPTEYDPDRWMEGASRAGLSGGTHHKAPRWLCIVGFRLGADGCSPILEWKRFS